MANRNVRYERVKVGPWTAADFDTSPIYDPNTLTLARDAILNDDGSIVMRPGWTDRTTSAHASYSAFTWKLFTYDYPTGFKVFIYGQDTNFYYGSATAMTSQHDPTWTGVTNCDHTVFNQVLYVTPDHHTTTNVPFKYDGSSFTGLTALGDAGGSGFYNAMTVLSEHERVFVGNLTENNVSDDNFPYRIRYSNADAAETWTAADYIDLNPDDGGEIMKLVSFQNSILIFREHAIYVLTGRSDESFTIYKLTSQYGLSGERSTIVFDDVVYFYYHKFGIVKFDGETFTPFTWTDGSYIQSTSSAKTEVDVFEYEGHIYVAAQNNPSADPDNDRCFIINPRSEVVTTGTFGWIHSTTTQEGVVYFAMVNPLHDATDQKRIFEFGASNKDAGDFIPATIWTNWITSSTGEPFSIVDIEFDFHNSYFVATSASNELSRFYLEYNGIGEQFSDYYYLTGHEQIEGYSEWSRMHIPINFEAAAPTGTQYGPRKRGIESFRMWLGVDPGALVRSISTWGIANMIVTIAIQDQVKTELTHTVT